MKKHLKTFFVLVLTVIVCSFSSISAFATNIELKTYVNQFNRVDLGNGISYEYSFIPDLSKAYTYTSATSYGRFFLTSNNETVATTELKVYFKYDGSSVEAYSSSASCEPKKADWAVSYGTTTYSTTTYNASGSAVFTLYNNGEYSNSLTAIVYCTKDGTTSSVIN